MTLSCPHDVPSNDVINCEQTHVCLLDWRPPRGSLRCLREPIIGTHRHHTNATTEVRVGLKTKRPRPVVSSQGASLSFTVPAKSSSNVPAIPAKAGGPVPPGDESPLSSDTEDDDFSSDEEDAP